MSEVMNQNIQNYMVSQVEKSGSISSKELIDMAQAEFKSVNRQQISGNLSTLCVKEDSLNYDNGIVTRR